MIVSEFGCGGILAQRNSNCSQAGLGWHMELYFPQTSCQASCLPLRPITIKASSTARLIQNKTRKCCSTLRLFLSFNGCWICQKKSPKTSLQEVRKCCLRATITALTTCWCVDENIPSISPVIRGNLTGHASYYRFYSTITTAIQVSCCETVKRGLWMTSFCVLFFISFILPLLSPPSSCLLLWQHRLPRGWERWLRGGAGVEDRDRSLQRRNCHSALQEDRSCLSWGYVYLRGAFTLTASAS